MWGLTVSDFVLAWRGCRNMFLGVAWKARNHVRGNSGPIKTCSSPSTSYVLMRFSFNIKGGIGYGLIMSSRVVSCQA